MPAMLTFLRWLGRVLLALLVVALIAIGVGLWKFEQGRKAKLAALDAGSKLVQTAAGPIEYTELGSGPAVLVCHGAPGGYDQAALLGESLAKAGFRVIAPSRPGFLRTPLPTGLLFEDQADAFAALLDTLGIKQAAVLGWTSGAPAAVDFALRHADRTSALVLVSPVTKPYQRDPNAGQGQLLAEAALYKTTGDMGAWFLLEQARRNPRETLDAVLVTDTKLDPTARAKQIDAVLADPEQLAFFHALLGTQNPLSPRETGTRNDILQLRSPAPLAYENIHAPTLLVQGSADAASPWADLGEITTKLPTAKVLTVKDAGSIVWLGAGAPAMRQAMIDFLKSPPPLSTPTPTPSPSSEASPTPTP
jgi:pimeloyl-ACP methyl ester carboxylesterase